MLLYTGCLLQTQLSIIRQEWHLGCIPNSAPNTYFWHYHLTKSLITEVHIDVRYRFLEQFVNVQQPGSVETDENFKL